MPAVGPLAEKLPSSDAWRYLCADTASSAAARLSYEALAVAARAHTRGLALGHLDAGRSATTLTGCEAIVNKASRQGLQEIRSDGSGCDRRSHPRANCAEMCQL